MRIFWSLVRILWRLIHVVLGLYFGFVGVFAVVAAVAVMLGANSDTDAWAWALIGIVFLCLAALFLVPLINAYRKKDTV